MVSALARRTARLGGEAAGILAGRSDRAPAKGDWRFQDGAWTGNPGYRRLMQLYLAWVETLGELVDTADIDWRDRHRARFAVELLTSAAAPTNTLGGNPAALKHALETGGLSLARGARNAVRDLRSNRGMPSTVD